MYQYTSCKSNKKIYTSVIKKTYPWDLQQIGLVKHRGKNNTTPLNKMVLCAYKCITRVTESSFTSPYGCHFVLMGQRFFYLYYGGQPLDLWQVECMMWTYLQPIDRKPDPSHPVSTLVRQELQGTPEEGEYPLPICCLPPRLVRIRGLLQCCRHHQLHQTLFGPGDFCR